MAFCAQIAKAHWEYIYIYKYIYIFKDEYEHHWICNCAIAVSFMHWFLWFVLVDCFFCKGGCVEFRGVFCIHVVNLLIGALLSNMVSNIVLFKVGMVIA